MRHKKTLFALLLTTISLSLGACSLLPDFSRPDKSNAGHVHSADPGASWQYDEKGHWKDCYNKDGYKVDYESHSFETIKEIEPTYDSAGERVEVCSVCGYEKVTSIEALSEKATITVNFVGLEARNNDIYVYLDCSATNATGPYNHIRVAFGLASYGADGSASATNVTANDFVVGHLNPEASDYHVIDSANNISSDQKSFDFRFYYKITNVNLSKTGGSNKGYYVVYFGTKENYGSLRNGETIDDIRQSDTMYRYNYRNDSGGTGNTVTLVVEEKPLFKFEEVTVYQDANNVVWGRIGGPIKNGVTPEMIAQVTPFIRFQPMISYKHIELSPEVVDTHGTNYDFDQFKDGLWHYEIDGNKAYVHFLMDFMDGTNKYNMHLNVNESVSQDCVLDINGSYEKSFSFNNDNRIFTAHFDPTGKHVPDNLYGNFGFFVTQKN